MKKRKKRGRHINMSASHQSPRSLSREMKPEELATYVRLAERQVLPLMKNTPVDAGAAQLLLALYTQALVTKNPVFSVESAMTFAPTVLALWQEGYYTPSPEYPYTLEETLQAFQGEVKAKDNYEAWVQPFTPMKADRPRGWGTKVAGIVKHPETHLWQIWMIVEGACAYFGAYRDPAAAQRVLEELIGMARSSMSLPESIKLYRQLSSQWDEEARELPDDMTVYLIEHMHRYTIVV